jgi:hypothetical protein
MKTFKLISGQGKCVEPELSMSDCTEVHEAIQVVDSAEGELKRQAAMFALAEKVASITDLAPNNQWMQVPSHRIAVMYLAAGLEDLISQSQNLPPKEYNRLVGRKLGPAWRVVLSYCADAASRALEELQAGQHKEDWNGLEVEADEIGREECTKTTKIDLFAKYHPAAKAAESNFASLESLNAFGSIGLEHLVQERVWEQLAYHSGITDTNSFQALSRRRTDLVLSAGDRGEFELELALAYHAGDPSHVPEPEGGERRLAEIRIDRELRNYVEAIQNNLVVDKVKLQNLLRRVDAVLEEELEWVPRERLMEAREACAGRISSWGMSEKCQAAGLPPTCTQADIDNAECSKFGLPAGCTTEDILALQERRQRCRDLNLPQACSREEIDAAQELRQKCHRLALPVTCTEEEIADLLRLRATCESLGISEVDCTQDHIDQKEALINKCVAAGLDRNSTQEELDQVSPVQPEIVDTAPKPFCAVRERTNLKFGLNFAYHVKSGQCNKVSCRPLMFFQLNGFISDFMTAESGDRRRCTCFAHQSGEKKKLLDFIHNDDCGVSKCLTRYGERMAQAKYPGRYLLKEQRLEDMDHWEAECVEEDEAITSIPEPPRPEKKQAGSVLSSISWPPSRQKTTKFVDAVRQMTSVSNIKKNFE